MVMKLKQVIYWPNTVTRRIRIVKHPNNITRRGENVIIKQVYIILKFSFKTQL